MRAAIAAAFAMVAIAAGCSALSPSLQRDDVAASRVLPALGFPTNTPAPKHLYVDHGGIFFEYSLPLTAHSKPSVAASEAPGSATVALMTADQFGRVAIATPTELLFYKPPIRTFAAKAAQLAIPLTPAITQMGTSGAVLADVEFDPNENFWLLNNVGGLVTMLPAPINKHSVATVTIGFGTPDTKAASYGILASARFDVNSTLYVYAKSTNGVGLLFKTAFPYANPPSPVIGLDLGEPDFVDPSQFPNGPPIAFSDGMLYGAYLGPLASPPPQQPPPPPTYGLAQFTQPFFPNPAVYPNAMLNLIASALVADANRNVLYTLETANGNLAVYSMPFDNHAKPLFTLKCAAMKQAFCDEKPEHLYLAP